MSIFLCVLGVLCGFLDRCWESTAEDAGDAEGCFVGNTLMRHAGKCFVSSQQAV